MDDGSTENGVTTLPNISKVRSDVLSKNSECTDTRRSVLVGSGQSLEEFSSTQPSGNAACDVDLNIDELLVESN